MIPPPVDHRGYPVTLRIAGRPCLVVGGSRAAVDKAVALAECGGEVTVVAPTLDPEAAGALDRPGITVEHRRYESGETARYRLVITATGIPSVDRQVAADAEGSGVWSNSVDDVGNCSFFLPSVHRDGPVTIAVSTGGASPALASWLRQHLGRAAGEGLGDLAVLLAAGRRRLQADRRPTSSVDWQGLLDGPLPALVRSGQLAAAAELVETAVSRPRPGPEPDRPLPTAAPPSEPLRAPARLRSPKPTGR